ncbi:NACHT domain-containing protein [Streptomyces laurentii]|uniref:NACHT domain-containing protein n=1 Tax=Streptomyces laurentii TaxID=39478 RepID=UPI00367E8C62
MPSSDQLPPGSPSIKIGDVGGSVVIGDRNFVFALHVDGASAGDALNEVVSRLVEGMRVGRGPVDEGRARQAGQLADDVLQRLTSEVERLRLTDQDSLPVHWRPALRGTPGDGEDGEDIREDPGGASGVPLPGLTSRLDEITADSRWLLVIGRGGSGKSVLALQFAKSRLERRSPDRREPVPVIFSMGSWNPGTAELRAWLIDRLERDYLYLAHTVPGKRKTWAAELLGTGYVLPILDGFDEINKDLRKRALNQLNSSTLPLVVTSRRDAIEAVVKDSAIAPSAAAIELVDLDVDDSVRYLCKVTRTAPPDGTAAVRGSGWGRVVDELSSPDRTQAGDDLAAVLATPLMTTLARFAYESRRSGHDPSDLLTAEKLGTQDALEKHLLDFFVRTAYERFLEDKTGEGEGNGAQDGRWDAAHVRRWLGCLAADLTKLDTTDIEWWRMGTALKLRWVMLRVGLTVGVASGLVAGLVFGAEGALLNGPAYGLTTAVVSGLADGAGLGLTFGLIHGFATKMRDGGPMFTPSRMEISRDGWEWKNMRNSFRPRVQGGLLGGLLFGLVWALGVAALNTLAGATWSVIWPFTGLLFAEGTGLGLALGLVAAVGAGFEKVIPQEKADASSDLLNTNRATVLKQLVTVGLVIGVGHGTLFGIAYDSALNGIGAGLAAGAAVALGIGSMTAWGRWVILGRIWLRLTGRVPSDLDAFLRDAYARGVLRRQGAAYQFRHERLQKHLAEAYGKK